MPERRHHGWRVRLRHLQEATTPEARRFRYGLLALDAVGIGWIVAASFLPLSPLVFTIDVALGLVLLAEFVLAPRSEEHTSELQSHVNLVCRLLLEKKKKKKQKVSHVSRKYHYVTCQYTEYLHR